jgi:hypothetical protein
MIQYQQNITYDIYKIRQRIIILTIQQEKKRVLIRCFPKKYIKKHNIYSEDPRCVILVITSFFFILLLI